MAQGKMGLWKARSLAPSRAGVLAAVVVLGTWQPAAALSGVTIVSYMALVTIVADLLFLYLGLYAPRNFFLLMGNMLCVAANCVFVMMLAEQQGNDSWLVGFVALAVANTVGTLSVLKKYKEQGCASDSDSEDEDGYSEGEGEGDEGGTAAAPKHDPAIMDKATRRAKNGARRRKAQRRKGRNQD